MDDVTQWLIEEALDTMLATVQQQRLTAEEDAVAQAVARADVRAQLAAARAHSAGIGSA